MSKLIKALVYLVASVVVLIIGAAVVVPKVIDANDYKPRIAAAVKEQVGREISIAGELDLSVFPWLGVETNEISLSNAPGFGDTPFANIGATQIKVKLLPLLAKRIEVSRIVLKDLNINLARNKEGVSNWEDLVQKTKTDQTRSEEHKEPDSDRDESSPIAVTVAGLSVENAKVVWDDRQKGQHIEISDFNFFMEQLDFDEPVDFELKFSLHNQQPKLTENLTLSGAFITNASMDEFKIDGLKLKSQTVGDDIPGGSLDSHVAFSADANLKDQNANISGLRLNISDLLLTGELKGTNIIDSPVFSGPIIINELNPKKFLKSLGIAAPETSDGNALRKFKAKFDLNATANSLAIHGISIQLDETAIKGMTQVANFSYPMIGFDFEIDRIDVDRYLPGFPAKEKTEHSTTSESAGPVPATQPGGPRDGQELPLRALAALNLDGKARINNLKVSGIKANGVTVEAKGKNGIFHTKQSVGDLYQGRYQGTTRIDGQGSTPRITMTESLSNLKVEPFLLDATGKAPISGTAQFRAQLNGSGVNIDAIKSSLNGTVDGLFTDGAIKGFDIIKIIRTAKSALNKEQTQQTGETGRTHFSEIKFAANISNGVINNHELVAKSPLVRANGSGTVNLVNEKIDYKFMTKLVGSLSGRGGEEMEELKGIPIAINLGGTLSNPSYRLDLADMLKEKHKAKIEEKKEELLKKLDEKVGPGASELLKKLF